VGRGWSERHRDGVAVGFRTVVGVEVLGVRGEAAQLQFALISASGQRDVPAAEAEGVGTKRSRVRGNPVEGVERSVADYSFAIMPVEVLDYLATSGNRLVITKEAHGFPSKWLLESGAPNKNVSLPMFSVNLKKMAKFGPVV